MSSNNVTINDHPATTPTLETVRYFDKTAFVYAYPEECGVEGFAIFSADTGDYLCWSARREDIATDAALVLMEESRGFFKRLVRDGLGEYKIVFAIA